MGNSKDLKQIQDLNWVYTLGEADLSWVLNSLDDIKGKIGTIKEESVSKGVHPVTFHNLEKFLEMFQYVMMDRHNYWSDEKEESQKEIKSLGESK